jgi:hypothetical protein
MFGGFQCDAFQNSAFQGVCGVVEEVTPGYYPFPHARSPIIDDGCIEEPPEAPYDRERIAGVIADLRTTSALGQLPDEVQAALERTLLAMEHNARQDRQALEYDLRALDEFRLQYWTRALMLLLTEH